MPHITIEYSANVGEHHNPDEIVRAVHQAALDDGLPPADGLRTRAVARENYIVADGRAELAFVAIYSRIGPGREAEAKKRFLTAILDAAEAALIGTPLRIAWSAEVTEIDPEFRINRNYVRGA